VVVVVVGVVLGMSTSSVLWAASSGRILLAVVAVGITMGVTLLGVSFGWCGLHVELLLLLVVETVVV
jgi:hypothetical protein